MHVNQRDIVLVDFPYSSFDKSKIRPALVVSHERYNRSRRDCIIVPLTTSKKPARYIHPKSPRAIETGVLLRPSGVRFDRLICISQTRILQVIARMGSASLPSTLQLIKKLFS